MRNKLSKLFPKWISGGKLVTKNGIYYYNPRTLTPNQEKWKDRYLKLSTDEPEAFEEIPEEYHIVYEWENGWLDYSTYPDEFFVWSLYSHRKENDKDGLDMNKGGDAIKIAGNMARVRGYKTMKWDTHRNPRAWKLACKEEGKVRVVSSEVEIELFKKRLDINN
tara:strand:+ start:89 stop:580 length:492 start_codon:yes stop_codon:yes gene_type:complete